MSKDDLYYQISFDKIRKDFRADRKVDKYSIDDCAEEQSNLFGMYVEVYADAKFERDEAEHELDLLRAELNLQVRSDPNKFGIDGDPKEGAIKSAIELDDKVIEARQYYNEKRRETIAAKGMVDSMDQRKVMIKLLGELWLREYYSLAEVTAENQKQYDDYMSRKKREVKERRKSNE